MTEAENVLNSNCTHMGMHSHKHTTPLGEEMLFVTFSNEDLTLSHHIYTNVNKIYFTCHV